MMKKTGVILLMLLWVVGMQAQKEVYQSPLFTLTVPENGGDGRCVVLCPGGGYNHVAGSHEGSSWIPFFNSQGISVAVTTYTLPEGDCEKPLGDVRTVFKMLREKGSQWGINPNGIGIMGFSAGGHLAAAFTNSEVGDHRPAFCILMYPVVRMDTRKHEGMAKKFLGDDCTMELRKQWSTQQMVSAETPPTIILTADDDPVIDPTNSTDYYQMLKKHHVQATMHIYPCGGHGFGFRTTFPYHDRLVQDLTDWLKTIHVPAAKAVKVACIGNSITYGARLKFPQTESYPMQLQKLLGDGYWVKNFGISGSTMIKSGNTFMERDRWQHAKEFLPDIVFIKLGTNDIKSTIWKGDETFVTAYQHMIDTLWALPSKPLIVLCLPATSYRTNDHLDSNITSQAIPLIRQVAKKNKLQVIDLHTPTSGQPERFPDQLHPDAQGAGIIAHTLYDFMQKHKLKK